MIDTAGRSWIQKCLSHGRFSFIARSQDTRINFYTVKAFQSLGAVAASGALRMVHKTVVCIASRL